MRLVSRRNVLGTAGALTAAWSLPRQAKAAVPGQCIDAFTQEAVNFNPLLYVNTGVETAVEYSVFDPLWQIDPAGTFTPRLAMEMPSNQNGGISADGLTWTIKLRPHVTWHDGAPFTSADVGFTLDTLMNPKVAVRSRNGHDHVADYDIPDALTMRIRLKGPFAPYLVAWQKTSIIPRHILASEANINTSTFNTNPLGTGPFKFKERVAGDHIAFTPNDDYFGGKPKLTSLIQKYVPDQQTLYAQFQTGEITVYDSQGIPPQLFERAKSIAGSKILLSPSPFVEFIYFNLGKPQFKEKVVRQALFLAMDRKAWINAVYYGLAAPTLSYLPPDHWAYNRNLRDPGFDPAKAAKMLDEAGWTIGSDGVRAKGDVRLAFSMSTTAGAKAREQAQQLLQQNFKKINVELTIRNMPASIVWGDYTVRSQFDTLMVGWDALLFPDPDYTDRIASDRIPVKSGTGSNYVQYENPEVDRLCALGTQTADLAKRKEIYGRLQEILLEDLPFAPIFCSRRVLGVSDRLTGYVPNPYTPCNSWNTPDWSVT